MISLRCSDSLSSSRLDVLDSAAFFRLASFAAASSAAAGWAEAAASSASLRHQHGGLISAHDLFVCRVSPLQGDLCVPAYLLVSDQALLYSAKNARAAASLALQRRCAQSLWRMRPFPVDCPEY